MRAREVRLVDIAASFGLAAGVQAEKNMDRFAPIGSVTFGVQEPQIELHMLAVVRRERVAERRFVQKRRCRLSHQATIVARINLVNRLLRLDALYARQGWRL